MVAVEQVVVDGREVRVTNRGKVLYPASETTKGEVIDYYARVAPVMVPDVAGRPVTRKRWPNGVELGEFFAKDLDPGTPGWVPRVQIPHDDGPKFYPMIDSAAGLVWMGQIAALELHVPQWRIEPAAKPAAVSGRRAQRFPDRVVLDLDPGPGAGLPECVRVALLIRERLGWLGERIVPVTSGSKGLHLYVPMDDPIPSEQASGWARQIAEQMELGLPDLVVSNMSKALRTGRVLVDWSQNHAAKTTIAPYSLRGRDQPTVAAPRTWDELADPGLAHLTMDQVLDRVAAGINPMAGFHAPVRAVPIAVAGAGTTRTRPATRPTPARTRPQQAKKSAGPVRPIVPAEPGGFAGKAAAAASGENWAPMLATPGTLTGLSAEGVWRFEGKWDGVRALAHLESGWMLRSRTGRDITAVYPELAELPGLVAGRRVVLDGEVVALNGQGRTDFGLLQHRMGLSRLADVDRVRRTIPVAFLIFDILPLDRESFLQNSYDERRRILVGLGIAGRRCVVPDQLHGDPGEILARTRQDGWEGIMAKRADSLYLPGQRTHGWVKIKNLATVDAAIVGWQPGRGRRTDSIGSLLLALPDGNRGWRYIGKVGTGFTDAHLAALAQQLAPLETAESPLTGPAPAADLRGARWVTPTLVGEVAYSEYTHTGTLRQPRWKQLRPDLTPSDL